MDMCQTQKTVSIKQAYQKVQLLHGRQGQMSAHRAVNPGVALVHYPDGTEDEVEIPVTVKKQK